MCVDAIYTYERERARERDETGRKMKRVSQSGEGGGEKFCLTAWNVTIYPF
jgi:hypothetical protein